MEEVKVVGWVDFDSDYPTKNYANEDIMKIINIIQQNIVDNGYKFSGEEHQYRKNCAPLLSDGTCFRASMRLFGMMMAGVHGYLDKKEYSYMDFYMSLDDSKTPEDNDINIEVNKDVESSIGYSSKEDYQVIGESLSFGMDFMTTDKVLKKLYLLVKEKQKSV